MLLLFASTKSPVPPGGFPLGQRTYGGVSGRRLPGQRRVTTGKAPGTSGRRGRGNMGMQGGCPPERQGRHWNDIEDEEGRVRGMSAGIREGRREGGERVPVLQEVCRLHNEVSGHARLLGRYPCKQMAPAYPCGSHRFLRRCEAGRQEGESSGDGFVLPPGNPQGYPGAGAEGTGMCREGVLP